MAPSSLCFDFRDFSASWQGPREASSPLPVAEETPAPRAWGQPRSHGRRAADGEFLRWGLSFQAPCSCRYSLFVPPAVTHDTQDERAKATVTSWSGPGSQELGEETTPAAPTVTAEPSPSASCRQPGGFAPALLACLPVRRHHRPAGSHAVRSAGTALNEDTCESLSPKPGSFSDLSPLVALRTPVASFLIGRTESPQAPRGPRGPHPHVTLSVLVPGFARWGPRGRGGGRPPSLLRA